MKYQQLNHGFEGPVSTDLQIAVRRATDQNIDRLLRYGFENLSKQTLRTFFRVNKPQSRITTLSGDP